MKIEERASEIYSMLKLNIDNTIDCDDLQITELSFAWASLEFMNDRLKKVNGLFSDKTFMASREKLSNEVQKYSNMLGLNRSQRLKLQDNSNATSSNIDPLEELTNAFK